MATSRNYLVLVPGTVRSGCLFVAILIEGPESQRLDFVLL
jgi:hypothetical protein